MYLIVKIMKNITLITATILFAIISCKPENIKITFGLNLEFTKVRIC